MHRDGRVAGRVALITGGAGGIGAASAAALKREGATVVIADLAANLDEVAASVGCEAARLDVGNEAEWTALVADIVARHGALHVLVNGAGIEGDQAHGTPEHTSLEEWRRVQRVNMEGVFLGCKVALPVMRGQKGASIINIASGVTVRATPGSTAYGVSKAGVAHLTKTVALYGARQAGGVRCNSVHPGMIQTRMLGSIYAQVSKLVKVDVDLIEDGAAKSIPLGELGRPEDIANMVLFLASDEARYITGGEFFVDGGWNLHESKR